MEMESKLRQRKQDRISSDKLYGYFFPRYGYEYEQALM